MLRTLSLMALVVAAICAGGAFTPASAEEWRDIDCANSKIGGPSGLKCRQYGPYHSGGCQTTVSNRYGEIEGRRVLGRLRQSSNCHSLAESMPEFAESLKTLFGKALEGATWDAPRLFQQQYVLTGQHKNRACVAFRIYGPAQGRGHQYHLSGYNCKPEGQITAYTDDEIREALAMFSRQSV